MKMLSIPVTQEHIDAAVAAQARISVCQCCIVYQSVLGAGLNPSAVTFHHWWQDDGTRFLLGPECLELTGIKSDKWKTVTPRSITVQVPE